jgi:TolA-binding protein
MLAILPRPRNQRQNQRMKSKKFWGRAPFLIPTILLFACNANSPENKFFLAEKLLEDKKYDAAISEFQTIVEKSPYSPIGIESQLKVAQIQHLYLGRAQEAISAYRELLKRVKDPKQQREIEKVLADLQFQSVQDYDQAIASYKKLIQEDGFKEDAEALYFRLGRSLFLNAKFDDAVKMFDTQKERFPSGALFWKAELEAANSLSAKGNCTEAIKRFDKVITEGKEESKVLAIFSKASCLEEQDELDSAYELFSSIKSTYPSPTVVELKMQKIKRRKILRKR